MQCSQLSWMWTRAEQVQIGRAALLSQRKLGPGLGIVAGVRVPDEVKGLQQRANPQELVEGRHCDAIQHSLHLRRVGGGHGHMRYARRIQAPRHTRQVSAGCTQEQISGTPNNHILHGNKSAWTDLKGSLRLLNQLAGYDGQLNAD